MVDAYVREADARGVMVLCIHADADGETDEQTFVHKIIPAFTRVEKLPNVGVCKNLAAVVPVQMLEAWMLCDKDLLKKEIGTQKSNAELGLEQSPEAYSNPKQTIMEAIRVAQQNVTRQRQNKLDISDLYLPLGQKIALSNLADLPSYQKFRVAIQQAFRKLNYLY